MSSQSSTQYRAEVEDSQCKYAMDCYQTPGYTGRHILHCCKQLHKAKLQHLGIIKLTGLMWYLINSDGF